MEEIIILFQCLGLFHFSSNVQGYNPSERELLEKKQRISVRNTECLKLKKKFKHK